MQITNMTVFEPFEDPNRKRESSWLYGLAVVAGRARQVRRIDAEIVGEVAVSILVGVKWNGSISLAQSGKIQNVILCRHRQLAYTE